MLRRTFLIKSALSTAMLGVIPTSWSLSKNIFKDKDIAINGQRIEGRIAELAKFGRDADGHGYRVAYTSGDIDGRAWFKDLMTKAGLDVRIDEAGNIVGKRKGKNASLKPIAFGSHIDMVPDGGNYDGTFGSISALEVIETLNENKWITNHPLEVIIFANEEGGTFGSKALAGLLTPEGLQLKSQSGLTIGEGIKAIGGDPDNIHACVRKSGDIHAFVELHIEQGGILEKESLHIGVVEGIVGIMDWDVTVEGVANHAGSTPMNLRHDALLAASKLVVAVNEVITSVDGRQVGTVGKIIEVKPNASNVIPGTVKMSLEIRDLSFEKIQSLFAEVEKRASVIANESGTRITFNLQLSNKPALTSKPLQQKIDTNARRLGLTTKFMQSGAIHDTQNMSLFAPVAMIFVPSVGGISHSPKEFTKASDMSNGANVLLQTVLAIDRE